MKRAVLIGLCFVWSTGTAQTASVPTVILDSLIFETKLSRQCSLALEAIQAENKALGEELLHTGTALELSQRSNETLSALLRNSRESQEIQGLQFQKDLTLEKRKTKRWRKVAVFETVAVIVGIIILL